jgi:hypothetical protein
MTINKKEIDPGKVIPEPKQNIFKKITSGVVEEIKLIGVDLEIYKRLSWFKDNIQNRIPNFEISEENQTIYKFTLLISTLAIVGFQVLVAPGANEIERETREMGEIPSVQETKQ